MNKKVLFIIFTILVVVLFIVVSFFVYFNNQEKEIVSPVSENNSVEDNIINYDDQALEVAETPIASIANPASENCLQQGGQGSIQTKEDGSQYSLCYFDDARACEEWAMFRGECPVGGVKTTGYDTVEQKYCAWVGGRTFAVENAVCTFEDNSTCSVVDLYSGACQKGDSLQK